MRQNHRRCLLYRYIDKVDGDGKSRSTSRSPSCDRSLQGGRTPLQTLIHLFYEVDVRAGWRSTRHSTDLGSRHGLRIRLELATESVDSNPGRCREGATSGLRFTMGPSATSVGPLGGPSGTRLVPELQQAGAIRLCEVAFGQKYWVGGSVDASGGADLLRFGLSDRSFWGSSLAGHLRPASASDRFP